MDDLISRQATIDVIRKCNVKEVTPAYMLIDKAEAMTELMMLPSAQPEQWIPCSERLPDAQTEVVVSCTDDSGDTKFRYTSSGWVTTDKEYWIIDNEINNFVVAWREMPEPYKGEQ